MIFCGMGLRQRAAEHGEVLGEDEDRAAVDRAPAGDDAVAGDLASSSMPKSVAAMLDEHVEFLERALVEQQLDALARGQLAAGVLRLDALLAAAELGRRRGALRAFRECLSCGPARSRDGLDRVRTWHFCRTEAGFRPRGLTSRRGMAPFRQAPCNRPIGRLRLVRLPDDRAAAAFGAQ